MSRFYYPLPLALIVSALLFLMACPFKTGSAGSSSATTDAPVVKRPAIHYFTDPYKAPHVAKISLPRPHHPSGQWRVPRFLEDERPSEAMHRATP